MKKNKKKKSGRHRKRSVSSQTSTNLSLEEQVDGLTLDDVPNKTKPGRVLLDMPDSKTFVTNTEDEEGVPKYNPELAIPVVLSGTDRYDRSRSKNGCAIIFNFEDFQNYKTYQKRVGSQEDVDRLVKVFGDLNIDIGDRVYKNMTYNSMQERLKEFLRMKPLLSDSNALIVVILSHGLEGDKVMASDCEFHLYDMIKMFTPEELQEIAARPKIFIIQACRGEQIDSGSILKAVTFSFDHTDSGPVDTPFKYPSYADICIALSSHHGHYSFRNLEGSWFIQSLCDVLEEIDLEDNHLLDILSATSAEVATRASNSEDTRFDDKKQVSSFYTTFTKKFYLKRKD